MQKLDRKYIFVIWLLGAALCAFHVLTTLPADFAIDLPMHQAYIEFLVFEHRLPNAEDGVLAYYHLPLYYITAAVLHYLAGIISLDPLQFIRIISLISYAAYLWLAILLVDRLVGQYDKKTVYLALLMVVGWPVGVAISGRIHPEPFAYIGHIGMMYSLICWIMDRRTNALANAFLFTGLFLLARNFAIFFAAIASGFLLLAMWQQRHQLRQLLTSRMLLSILFCIGCYYLSATHRDIIPTLHANRVNEVWTIKTLFTTFLYFNPWVYLTETGLSPNFGRNMHYHLHYFSRSALLGGFDSWKAWPVVFAANATWLGIIIYTLWGGLTHTLRRLNRDEKKPYALILFFILMMIGLSMAARFFHPHMPNISDARYVFPITILFLICFIRVTISFQQAKRQTAAAIGRGLMLGMTLSSIGIIIGQFMWDSV